MIDTSSNTALVTAAAAGDQTAWNQLVDRYTPLVLSVIRRYRLSHPDAADVNQTLWLRLVEQLSRIREPEALPKWIITTTHHECLRLLRTQRRTRSFDPINSRDLFETANDNDTDLAEDLIRIERYQALREGFAQLTERCRTLLARLLTEPPPSYTAVSEQLAIPVGSIGPTRLRCLDKLRKSPAILAFLETTGESGTRGGEQDDVTPVG